MLWKIKMFAVNLLENTLSRSAIFRRLTTIGYYGLNKIDKHLDRMLPASNGYFVELGANDGLSQSNTLFLEKYKNYSGVLIEPFPQNYNLCKSNRSARNYFYLGACVSFDYKDEKMQLAHSNLMTTPLNGESSFDDPIGHAREGELFLNGDKIHIFTAKVSTLNDILIDAKAPEVIDLLSLDVEGGELEVLKGIDHKRFRFRIICVETNRIELVKNFLEVYNYSYHKKISEHDFLFLCNL